ncbi:MAG TPA: FecR family protein [Candidatus Wallbacteria bacterium]|nr:MAG: FecR protein [bacterium ADurb.Bin243]HOD39436.1 FecR family protein [Candidatus Wallbacteria bacterium]HPG58060.1 FecR family protein [Candidatus Wallbacteria bacterium]
MKIFIKTASLLCLTVLITIISINLAYSNSDIINVGKVSLLAGTVQIQRGEQTDWLKLSFDDKINVGDKIKVADESKLEICYNDGNILRVTPNSELEIALESIKLYNGQTWLRIVKVGSKFEVIAPTFVAGVRGTVFAVTANAKNNKKSGAVKVWKGSVETKTPQKAVMVTEGLHTSIDEAVISEPVNFDPKVANEFSEGSWQANDADTAYKRYINLLFSGIDSNLVSTNPELKRQLEERKKLPEISEAYNTYKNYNDAQAIENAINQ